MLAVYTHDRGKLEDFGIDRAPRGEGIEKGGTIANRAAISPKRRQKQFVLQIKKRRSAVKTTVGTPPKKYYLLTRVYYTHFLTGGRFHRDRRM